MLYALETVRGKEDTGNWVGAGAAAGGVTSLLTGEKRAEDAEDIERTRLDGKKVQGRMCVE